MKTTPRDIAIILFVIERYVADSPTLRRLFFPGDKNGDACRKRLNVLRHLGLLNKLQPDYGIPDGCPETSVYYPSREGCRLAALETGRMELLQARTDAPNRQHVKHFL